MLVGSCKPQCPFPRRAALLLTIVVLMGDSAYAQDGGAAASHRIMGTVHDSTATAPLPGALVQLISRSNRAWARSATSGPDGRFVFDSVPAGAYALGFLHPRLDSLHIAPRPRDVLVPGADSLFTLAIPSVTTIASVSCPETLLRDDEALFIGRVRPAREMAPASAGRVSVQWSETVIDNGVHQRRPMITAETDKSGAFVICGVPVATPVRVQGVLEDGETGVVELAAPTSRLLLRDLLTAPVDRVRTIAATDAAGAGGAQVDDVIADSITRLRGPGRLRGAVRTAAGAPLAGARVRVRESLAETVSDSAGRFELRGLPLGTHAIEAIAVGYAPQRQAADIGETDTTRFVVTMSPVDVTLDAVRVFGERRTPIWKREFDSRRAQGMGRFVDAAAIARRNPMMASDVLAGIPGVTIRTGLFTSQSQLLMRDHTGGYCIPDVVVDGILVDVAGMSVDTYVMASRLVGVEIYRSDVLRPVEFPRTRKCGLIVLWTGNRDEPPR